MDVDMPPQTVDGSSSIEQRGASDVSISQVPAASHAQSGRTQLVLIALVVVNFYALWFGVSTATLHQDPRVFATLGSDFAHRSNASPVLSFDPSYAYPSQAGYDGQFAYMIAMDPQHAAAYMDDPPYRWERPLYPLVARIVGLGNPQWIPYTLVLVNLLAVIGGTLALAAWLLRRGMSPWFSLIFGLFPGMFFAATHDLNEALAYSLVALAVYLYDYAPGRGRVAAAGVFALAALTREVTLLLAMPFGLALLWPEGHSGHDWGGITWHTRLPDIWHAAVFCGIAAGPFVIWKIVLTITFGSTGLNFGLSPLHFPLAGLFAYWPFSASGMATQIEALVLPGLVCLIVGFRALARPAGWSAATVALVLNAWYLVLALDAASYFDYSSSGRIQTGVVLAALLALPVLDKLRGQRRTWITIAATLWLVPLPLMYVVPLVNGYLITAHLVR